MKYNEIKQEELENGDTEVTIELDAESGAMLEKLASDLGMSTSEYLTKIVNIRLMEEILKHEREALVS